MAFVDFNGPVIFDIPAEPAAMFMVRAIVGKLADRIGFLAEEADKLVLAVDEACTNVIRHAYKNSNDKRIVITFTLNVEYLEILIRDFGSGSDPATFQPRNLEEIRPGGLGIHFIRSAFDMVEYDSAPGGGMLLKMRKLRPKQWSSHN